MKITVIGRISNFFAQDNLSLSYLVVKWKLKLKNKKIRRQIMKTVKKFKANWSRLFKRQSDFLKKSFFIGITAASLSILSGCQEQIATRVSKNSDYPLRVSEITFNPLQAQLASKVVLNNNLDERSSKSSHQYIKSPILGEMIYSQFNSTLKLNLSKESWKDSYDGIGVPLLKISF